MVVSASLLILTSPARFPERVQLLHRAIERAINQRLRDGSRHEVIVLDDEPECAAWPVTVSHVQAAEEAGVTIRYVALPPSRSGGRVNMRLKRNAGLLLCTGAVAVFCDDDDWRSPESVQAQLDTLEAHDADVCTVQVRHVCELDPSSTPSVRYFEIPDGGGGIFSARLGNPGTAALRRRVWEANPALGYPDTPCEDVDFVRLLLADSPLLASVRPHRCAHVLLDRAALRSHGDGHATCMTVRLVGFHHEWPLQPLDRSPMASTPSCLDSADVAFYEAHCSALRHSATASTARPPPAPSSLPPPPLPPPPARLDAVLVEAAERMEAASRALLLLSALVQTQRPPPQSSPSASGPLAPASSRQASAADAVCAMALRLHTAATTTLSSARTAAQAAAMEATGPAADGRAAEHTRITVAALEELRTLSAVHRSRAEQQNTQDGAAVAARILEAGVMRDVLRLLELMRPRLPPPPPPPPPPPRPPPLWAASLVQGAAELAEEVLFRTSAELMPPQATQVAWLADEEPPGGIGRSCLLEALASVLADEALSARGHAAAAGALQHLLTRHNEQVRFASLPLDVCAAPLVAALLSAEATVRRRAAGAVCNASANEDAMGALIDAGAAAALASLLPSSVPASLHVPLRALERLCTVSARAREQAEGALPDGALLSCLADLLSMVGTTAQTGPPAQARTSASRIVAAFSRSEARHWQPASARPPARAWPPASVVYYTGVALEPWGPERLETGLGGSETAVLQLARRWVEVGRHVAVYLRQAPAGEAGAGGFSGGGGAERTWRGVRLLDVSRFNPADAFDTLVVWRSLEVLDEPLQARVLLLDLHDMPRLHDMSERRLARVDRLMLKSDFQLGALPAHAATHPSSVIPNGVDEALVARVKAEVANRSEPLPTDEGARPPPQLVYTSSYDRGLEQMLRHGWPLVRQAVPQATLHLYYGWHTHELLYPVSSWREQMRALIASDIRVVDHGRVGQPELLRAKACAQILYYVGHWPEIDCIAAREAAMLGCVPLTSSVAVFGDRAKDYCCRVLGDPLVPETQHAAARRAIEILLAYQRTGELPSVDTPTLRSETWAAVAGRWLEVMGQ